MSNSLQPANSPINSGTGMGIEQRDARLGSQPIEASLPCAINSEALLRGQPSVTIAHHGAIYRLQTTRQGKLILTK
jgi:hemin uptake protein HemP